MSPESYLRHVFWFNSDLMVTGSQVISVECYTIKPLNLHMLIPWHYYLFDFVLFYCFQVLNKDAINSINFGLKAHFEMT
jgi:hypothetical protein